MTILPEVENIILKNNVTERKFSDESYAKKIVETVVFSLVGVIAIAVVVALLKTINL